MNQFCLLFDPVADRTEASVKWLELDQAGQIVHEGEAALSTLGELMSLEREAQLIVIVAGDRILTTDVEVEPQHEAHIRNVLPFLVEEQIAEDLDDVHIATAPEIAVGKNSVAVVSHTELIDWLDQLYSADLQPHMIVPEYLTLPDSDAGIRVLLRGDEAVVQFAAYKGTVLPFADLAAYLQLYKQQEDIVDRDESADSLILLIAEEDLQAKSNAELLSSQLDAMPVRTQEFAESSFALQAITTVRNKSSMLNLLQGGYRSQESDNPGFPWLKLAAVAATFLVIEFAMLIGSGLWFDSRAELLDARVEQQYRAIFPNERRVVDAKRQFQSHLNRQRSAAFSDEFLYLMERVVSAMGDNSLPVKSLRYDAYGDGLLLDLNAATMDTLEQYKTALANANLEVELLSAVEQGDTVHGRIRVEPI